MVIVDKGLVPGLARRGDVDGAQLREAYHEKRPDGVVEEYDGGSHEHGEANEFVKLRRRVSGH